MTLDLLPYGEPLTQEEAQSLGAFVEAAITERDAIDSSVDVALTIGTDCQVHGQALTTPPEPGKATEPLEVFLERVRTVLLAGGQVSLVEVSA